MKAQNLCLNNLYYSKVWVRTVLNLQQLRICYLLLSNSIKEWCSKFQWPRHLIKEWISRICLITCLIRLSLEDFSSNRMQLPIRILHLRFICLSHSTQLIKEWQISNSYSSIHPHHISKTLWCNHSFSMLHFNNSNNSSLCSSINNNNKTSSLNQAALINFKVNNNSIWIRCEHDEWQNDKCSVCEDVHTQTIYSLNIPYTIINLCVCIRLWSYYINEQFIIVMVCLCAHISCKYLLVEGLIDSSSSHIQ